MKQKIIDGYRLTYDESIEMLNRTPKNDLYELANDLRKHFFKNRIATCMITNAKSGACSEDCKWCSQSSFYKTTSPHYPLVATDEVLKDALTAQYSGVKMFSMVTSGRKVSARELNQLCEIYTNLGEKTPTLKLCASLGLLTKSDLEQLFASGVKRYHCNIETAPSFFPNLCTTHTLEDKVKTIQAARELGMEICSGGIMGMGETMEQRVEMAVFLQQLKVNSIPINILQPIKGTPLENAPALSDEEVLTTFAIFRIINPTADIRFAGGRMSIKHIQEKALQCGVSAALVGNMLTTVGSNIEEDFKMFKRLNYEI